MLVLQAFALSCSIFMTLMAKFRHSLKADIGVFFPMIMLKAIEPPVVAASAVQGQKTCSAAPLRCHPSAPLSLPSCQATKAAVGVACAAPPALSTCEASNHGCKGSMALVPCFVLHGACHEG